MADKVKKNNNLKKDNGSPENLPEKGKKKPSSILKIIVILLIVLILAATGFALGIYLKFIDMQALADSWKLNQYPIIGKYFDKPKTNFETVELESQSPVEVSPASGALPIMPPVVKQSETMTPEKPKVDDAELQRQAKIKQQEEAKRISKTARLYGSMKPDEAVAILNQMDDDTVLLILNKMEDEQVAKIMALFDARRAAALSQGMIRGGRNDKIL